MPNHTRPSEAREILEPVPLASRRWRSSTPQIICQGNQALIVPTEWTAFWVMVLLSFA